MACTAFRDAFVAMCTVSDIYVAEMGDDHIVFYTWEPFVKQKKALLKICRWFENKRPSVNKTRVSMFCQDGYVECGLFGEHLDEELSVIPDTVFS